MGHNNNDRSVLPIHLMSSLGYEMVPDNVALTDAGLPL